MNKGIKFLDGWAQGDRNKPFFLTLSSQPPHFPHHLPPEYVKLAEELRICVELPENLKDNCEGRPWFHSTPFWGCMDTSPLDEEEWKTVIAYSHAHITMVDEALGLVLDTIDRLNLNDSTTVIFTADHGDMEGAHNRFDKGAYFYDEVWRIPLIIREPETSPATQDAYVSLIDIAETLFALTSAEASTDQPRQGRNLMPLVGTSERPSDWQQIAYGVYYRYNGYSFEVRASCNERYKYVWNPQDINELYNLKTDPHEMTNLANQPDMAEIESELHNQLLDWLNSIGDGLPTRLDQLLPAGTLTLRVTTSEGQTLLEVNEKTTLPNGIVDLATYEVKTDGVEGSCYIPEFLERVRDPRLVDPVADILGPDILGINNLFIWKAPEIGLGFPWHQDKWYFGKRFKTATTVGN